MSPISTNTTDRGKHIIPSRQRRRACLAYLCAVLFHGPSTDAFVPQTHQRTTQRCVPTAFFRVPSKDSRCQPSPIALTKNVFVPTGEETSLLMSTRNDNINSMGGLSGYSNNTDTPGGPPSSKRMQQQRHKRRRHEGGRSFDADIDTLNKRLGALRAEVIWESQVHGPPNSSLDPVQFVSAVVSSLREPDDPLPDSGFRTLLRSSSKHWREAIRRSVGAPESATEDSIARALIRATSRSDSPFALLASAAGAEDCEIEFPVDVLDFEDGTAWLQCVFHRCRGMDSTPLLATMWSLVQRDADGAWLIDDIKFHDLRNAGHNN